MSILSRAFTGALFASLITSAHAACTFFPESGGTNASARFSKDAATGDIIAEHNGRIYRARRDPLTGSYSVVEGPDGERFVIDNTPLSKIEAKALRAEHLVRPGRITRPSGDQEHADDRGRSGIDCSDPGSGFFNMGMFGVWSHTSSMGSGAFWSHSVFEPEVERQMREMERIAECQRRLSDCLAMAQAATSAAQFGCGAVLVSNPGWGVACYLGSEWLGGWAADRCWQSYARCMLGLAPRDVHADDHTKLAVVATRGLDAHARRVAPAKG